MKAFVRKEYPRRGRKGCTEAFNMKFGTQYNVSTIQRAARVLGCTELESYPTHYTLIELANMLNIKKDVLKYRVETGFLQAEKIGRRWMVPLDAAEPLIQIYLRTRAPWPALTARQAAKRLGYGHASGNTIGDAARDGYIDSVKIRNVLYVKLADIEAAERYMQRTGQSSVPWKQQRKWRDVS